MNLSVLRRELGVSVADFALLLGVHAATVYRWERAGAVLPESPLVHAVLELLHRGAHRRAPAAQLRWARRLVRAGHLRGSLEVLTLLVLDGPWPYARSATRAPSQRGPRRKSAMPSSRAVGARP